MQCKNEYTLFHKSFRSFHQDAVILSVAVIRQVLSNPVDNVLWGSAPHGYVVKGLGPGQYEYP